ncbi:MAG: hypothetical protein ACRD1V_03005 [Vicinamibacterales bacterium]
MRAKFLLQVNAAIGLLSAATALAMMWLVLTRPADMAASVADRDYGALALAIAGQFSGWLHTLIRFL